MNLTSFFDYPDTEANTATYNMAFLSEWGNSEWSKLLSHTQTYRFSAGDFAIRQGDTERAFYLVSFGQFEILSPLLNGGSQRRISLVEMGSSWVRFSWAIPAKPPAWPMQSEINWM